LKSQVLPAAKQAGTQSSAADLGVMEWTPASSVTSMVLGRFFGHFIL